MIARLPGYGAAVQPPRDGQMALSKTIVVDRIKALEMGQIQICPATVVAEDGTELSRSLHRQVLHPGDDTSGQDDRVVVVPTATWTPRWWPPGMRWWARGSPYRDHHLRLEVGRTLDLSSVRGVARVGFGNTDDRRQIKEQLTDASAPTPCYTKGLR